MGSSSGKLVVVAKCNHESGCQCSTLNIDRQLDAMRNEVRQQERLITENVKQEVSVKEDTLVMKYSDLKDMTEISAGIQEIFGGESVAGKFLKEAASTMVAVFRNSSAMKELMRWHQVKKVTKCKGVTVGMELHYKVVITEQKTGMWAKVGGGTTDTVVILGYKFIQQTLDVDANQLPNDEDLRSLSF